MGLHVATIDLHSHKLQTKLNRIPKFSVNRPNSKQDTAIWKYQNLQRNVWPFRCCLNKHPDGHAYISLLIFTLLNCCISVKTDLINTKLWDFFNLGALFLTMWINIVANPIIIYRLEKFCDFTHVWNYRSSKRGYENFVSLAL